MRHHAPLTTDCIDPENAIEKPPKIEGQPSGSSFKTASNPPLGVGLSPPVEHHLMRSDILSIPLGDSGFYNPTRQRGIARLPPQGTCWTVPRPVTLCFTLGLPW
jgi:hypothetical protein